MIRSLEPELMDSPDVSGPILDRFHRDLARVNGFLGTFRTVEHFLRRDTKPIRSVLDIGCGGGDLLRYLRRRMNVEVHGVDLKPATIPDIPVVAADATRGSLPNADVAICTLVAHHLTPEQNIELIRNVRRSCRRFLILDLIRHPLPLALFSVFLAPWIGHEAAVDGRLSIRRAYTAAEFEELVREALGENGGKYTNDVSFFRSRQVIDIHFSRY